ncbi:MAG: DNA-processing protein DprA [Symploca sp. SIO2E6]|nr:DNA-processing protein DprA [Symploca sp. SIO2E6]
MLNQRLSPNTQAILLLCASFGQNRKAEPQPLTLGEYNTVASWLLAEEMSPEDLLNPILKERLPQITIGKLDSKRLVALLERGMMLSLAVEKWTNKGLWVLGRGDAQYPSYLKQKLKHSAPAILYGVGNIELLAQGGLAVVGSRDVDEQALSYTYKVVQTFAKQGIQVVSGGARGVDQASMLGVLEAGGTAVGVLAACLTREAVSGKYRQSIREGRLALVSPYDPDVGFFVGNAMGRNKYIYALADYALVVSSSYGKGGTWAGAVEALEQNRSTPVFVRIQETVTEGNRQLLKQGAKIFPQEPWHNSLQELLEIPTSEVKLTKTEVDSTQQRVVNSGLNEQDKLKNSYLEVVTASSKDIIYQTVLPIILNYLEQPKDDQTLAESLDIQLGQMRNWLKKALEEGKIIKTKKPVKYVVNQKAEQLSLLN